MLSGLAPIITSAPARTSKLFGWEAAHIADFRRFASDSPPPARLTDRLTWSTWSTVRAQNLRQTQTGGKPRFGMTGRTAKGMHALCPNRDL
ncbi:hypothetical protein [Aurantiacibacter gangjinensis]|uniref:Uncharacterized protein n=1 Tax=Aurantiacibacter gangjinensis TaxID=502682 RepID=A0A0G9MM98_9SPHN|nr:hypothetical protein [Aurantiacibacter gangjinensis]APE27837.1 hypothetical protein BMF35_a1008 [Aurantiacibacter gangjinensis]KLE31815.1 hypothetical protein AAW01_10015 [Aurantiacibacter gangjinensis]